MVRYALAALAAAALAAALAQSIAPARADQGPALQVMRFAERGPSIFVTTDATSLFDSAAYGRLDDGLPTTVVIRLWVYPKGGGRPVAFQLLHRQVIYDLWDEVYQVAITGPGGRRQYRVKYRAEALKLMTAIDQQRLVDVAVVPYDEQFVVALVAELNPVSAATMAEVRRWLSDGSAGGLDRGGSFFGSFVSVFVNLKLPAADRVVRVRSQPFFRPRPR